MLSRFITEACGVWLHRQVMPGDKQILSFSHLESQLYLSIFTQIFLWIANCINGFAPVESIDIVNIYIYFF